MKRKSGINMFFKKDKKVANSSDSNNGLNWIKLNNVEQLNEIDSSSIDKLVIIFKHSTRCSISSSALNRLERGWTNEGTEKFSAYYLDLINYRAISNEIETRYKVLHESPQVIVIKEGKAIYNNSHMGINYNDLLSL